MTSIITLTVISGPYQGKVFTITGHDTFVVGRSSRAHFKVPSQDNSFSRMHFFLEANPPQCRLVDLGSRNGTFVNEQRMDSLDLKDGDLIRAGNSSFRFGVVFQADSLFVPIDALATVPPDVPEAKLEFRTRHSATTCCLACGGPLDSTSFSPKTRLCPECVAASFKQQQIVPGYLLIRELGRGAMGVIHLGLRERDERLVAVKTVLPAIAANRIQVERFLREARILKSLKHSNIVRFVDMGENEGVLFFVMEYVQGTDAARMLKEIGPFPASSAVGLTCQLLDALEYAHQEGFVHRDIKPANILVAKDGPEHRVKLADFGLARVYQASELSGLTLTGDIGGSIAFMPPEQITHYREASPLSDQYAVGATLYNLLTGSYMFDFPRTSKPHELLRIVLDASPVDLRQRNPSVPDEVAQIVAKSVSKDPNDRFAFACEMRETLLRLQL